METLSTDQSTVLRRCGCWLRVLVVPEELKVSGVCDPDTLRCDVREFPSGPRSYPGRWITRRYCGRVQREFVDARTAVCDGPHQDQTHGKRETGICMAFTPN